MSALKGQQLVIICLGVRASEDVQNCIAAAAAKAGVPFMMPNLFGYPLPDSPPKDDPYVGRMLTRLRGPRDAGVKNTLVMSCGFWYHWSLALGNQWFGISIKDRKVVFFDGGKRPITVSTWDQCGRALAALLSMPESQVAAKFVQPDGDVLISSFHVSQRDMLDSLNRVMGLTDADWDISHETTEQRIKDGAAELALSQATGGPPLGFAKMLYARVFNASNPSANFEGTANKVLGLPQEDLDKCTKETVEMVQNGWSPF